MTNAVKTKKSEYDIQAENFLKSTGATIEAIYTGHRPYFDDDKEFRATFQITIKKGDRFMVFNFGNSLVDSWVIKSSLEFLDQGKSLTINDYDYKKGVRRPFSKYFVVIDALKTGKEAINQKGISILKSIKTPSDYSILACLTKYNPGSFDDFCSDYGYDNDSIKASKTYQAVVKEYSDLCKVFTPEEIELLQEIQ